ncbi:hypothetical protein YPPY13_1605, partial [Yersinia pestis PY-13]
MHAIYRNINEK